MRTIDTSYGSIDLSEVVSVIPFLIQRVVEVVRHHEAPFIDAEHGLAARHRHKASYWLAGTGDNDFLPTNCPSQQAGKVGLCFVDAYLEKH